MNIISKFIETDTAHRVALHHSKCKNIHGHRYRFTVELAGDSLQDSGSQTGMILDYGYLKEIMVEHIDAMIDHGIIISYQDTKLLDIAYDPDNSVSDWYVSVLDTIQKNSFWAGNTKFGKTYIIQDYPTAEVLAKHFFYILKPIIDKWTNGAANIYSVIINETPTSTAKYAETELSAMNTSKDWEFNGVNIPIYAPDYVFNNSLDSIQKGLQQLSEGLGMSFEELETAVTQAEESSKITSNINGKNLLLVCECTHMGNDHDIKNNIAGKCYVVDCKCKKFNP